MEFLKYDNRKKISMVCFLMKIIFLFQRSKTLKMEEWVEGWSFENNQIIKKMQDAKQDRKLSNSKLPLLLATEDSPYDIWNILYHVMLYNTGKTVGFMSRTFTNAGKYIAKWIKKEFLLFLVKELFSIFIWKQIYFIYRN